MFSTKSNLHYVWQLMEGTAAQESLEMTKLSRNSVTNGCIAELLFERDLSDMEGVLEKQVESILLRKIPLNKIKISLIGFFLFLNENPIVSASIHLLQM